MVCLDEETYPRPQGGLHLVESTPLGAGSECCHAPGAPGFCGAPQPSVLQVDIFLSVSWGEAIIEYRKLNGGSIGCVMESQGTRRDVLRREVGGGGSPGCPVT